jgi:hypothetical protein
MILMVLLAQPLAAVLSMVAMLVAMLAHWPRRTTILMPYLFLCLCLCFGIRRLLLTVMQVAVMQVPVVGSRLILQDLPNSHRRLGCL